jgi:hypothetical protein
VSVGQELGDVGTGAWAVLQGDLSVSVDQELGVVGTGIDRRVSCTAGRLECEFRTGTGRCRFRSVGCTAGRLECKCRTELGDVGTGAWAVLQGDLNVSVGQELGDVGTGIDRSVGCTVHTAFGGYCTSYIDVRRVIILFYSYRLQIPVSKCINLVHSAAQLHA